MRSYGDVLYVCSALFQMYGIHFTIYLKKHCFYVKFWAGNRNKNWKKLCADFIDTYPDSYFHRCQPKRTTFYLPIFY